MDCCVKPRPCDQPAGARAWMLSRPRIDTGEYSSTALFVQPWEMSIHRLGWSIFLIPHCLTTHAAWELSPGFEPSAFSSVENFNLLLQACRRRVLQVLAFTQAVPRNPTQKETVSKERKTLMRPAFGISFLLKEKSLTFDSQSWKTEISNRYFYVGMKPRRAFWTIEPNYLSQEHLLLIFHLSNFTNRR